MTHEATHVGFTGTRHGMTKPQRTRFYECLRDLREEDGDGQQFHHGCCVGADEQAARIARAMGYIVHAHPPIDDKWLSREALNSADRMHRALDHMTRNDVIVASCAVLVATPLSDREDKRSGTWATVRHARRARNVLAITVIQTTGVGDDREEQTVKAKNGAPDPMTPDEREAHLVSWAKTTIDKLRQRVRDQDETINAASADHAGSEVALQVFRGGNFEDVPLPKGSKVRFKLPDPDFPGRTCEAEVWVERQASSVRPIGRLIINLSNGTINVIPSASNQIFIDSRRM